MPIIINSLHSLHSQLQQLATLSLSLSPVYVLYNSIGRPLSLLGFTFTMRCVIYYHVAIDTDIDTDTACLCIIPFVRIYRYYQVLGLLVRGGGESAREMDAISTILFWYFSSITQL